MLGSILVRKRVELELLRLGIPKVEINEMSLADIVMTFEILNHMAEKQNAGRD